MSRRPLRTDENCTTALRETEEEVGVLVDREHQLLGTLDEVRPGSRRLPPLVIAPFVAAIHPDVELHPDPKEVATALWVPLTALRDEANASEIFLELEGTRVAFPSYRYQDYEIWGLTHRILSRFLELMPAFDFPAFSE